VIGIVIQRISSDHATEPEFVVTLDARARPD